MTERDLALFQGEEPAFETIGRENGTTTWAEEDLQRALGYDSRESFLKAVKRAQKACLAIDISVEDQFIRETVVEDGVPVARYRLTRFACYLVTMNGDPRKPAVALAQAYFAKLAESVQEAVRDSEALDRVVLRDDLTEGQKQLASTAKQHGVVNFGFFQDAGYRGMYNMSLAALKRRKGVEGKAKLLDRMGRTELAANFFRVTQTEERIKRENITGQTALEGAAHHVGRSVRKVMMETGGTPPEALPIAPPIQEVERDLKRTSREFKKLDARRSRPDRTPPE